MEPEQAAGFIRESARRSRLSDALAVGRTRPAYRLETWDPQVIIPATPVVFTGEPMRLEQWKRVVVNVINDVNEKHIFSFAAALSYYFLLAFFPAVIALVTIVGHLPIPHLSNTIISAMARVMPVESMGLVRRVVADVTSASHGALLSLGLLGTLWTCSSGFATMIEALNAAYGVSETRPAWKTRLLAFELTFLIGFLVNLALFSMIVGSKVDRFLAGHFGLPWKFVLLWSLLRHLLAAVFMVLAIEGLYFLAPNAKRRFASSLGGAIFAVIGWLLLSDGLSIYFQKFSHLNKTYGVLGGGIALLVWLYWSGLLILLGAELNSRILQVRSEHRLQAREAFSPESAAAHN